MIKRNAFLAVLTIGLIIISLSGCQDIINQIPFLKNSSTRETQIIQTATPTSGPVFQQIPSPIPQQTNDLTFWIPPQFDPNNGTPAGNLLKKQVEKFTVDHPGVTVNVRIKAVSGSGGLLDSLSTASAAAPAILPGIVLLSRSDLESAAKNGLLLPLDAPDLNLNAEDWFPFAREISQARDTSYGIPFAGDALVLAYKPLQIGYPPLLWQDILQQQSILAIPASDPKATIALLLYMSLGGNFGKDEQNVTLQELPLQSSLQTFSDGAVANVFPYWLTEYTSFDQTWQALQDSRAAYAVIWSSQYLEAKPDNVTITPLPVYKDQIFTLADGWVLAFPPDLARTILCTPCAGRISHRTRFPAGLERSRRCITSKPGNAIQVE